MKSPGIIYRRYRQLKRKLLYDKIVRARETRHSNCHYGKVIDHGSPAGPCFTRFCVCSYDYSLNKDMVLCTCPRECNAFVSKWTREKVEYEFNKELEDYKTKLDKYPELVALEWVLDKDLTDAMKNPSFLGSLIVSVIMMLEKSLKYVNKKILH